MVGVRAAVRRRLRKASLVTGGRQACWSCPCRWGHHMRTDRQTHRHTDPYTHTPDTCKHHTPAHMHMHMHTHTWFASSCEHHHPSRFPPNTAAGRRLTQGTAQVASREEAVWRMKQQVPALTLKPRQSSLT
eukprot:1001577-Rhodomonas_salina.4